MLLDMNEYSDSKWVTPDELMSGDIHPALKVSAQAVLNRRKRAELQAAVEGGEGDADVARLARELCALSKPPPMGLSTYVVRSGELGYEGAVHVSRC